MLGRPFMSTSRTKIDVFGGMMTMEFDGDIIEHTIHDVNSMDFVCWINAFIPPDKENLGVDLVDHDVDPHADFYATSSDLHALMSIPDVIDSSPATVLGNSPTYLTPQGKVPASAIMQVVEKKLKHPPPEKSKYGGDQKKKVKQVWRATKVNGLRFKPFHSWFKDEILKAEVPRGPIEYG